MGNLNAFLNYLELEKAYAKHTLTSYSTDLNQFRSFLIDNFEVDDFTEVNYGMIRHWIVVLIDLGISHQSINRKLSALKTFYKFLLKIGAIEMSPMTKHKSLKLPKRQQEVLSKKELSNVSAYFNDSTFEGLRDHLIIDLLYSTGMRRQELIDLKLFHLNLSQKQLKVRGKRNKERLIPLLDSTLILLERYLSERRLLSPSEDAVFLTSKAQPIYPKMVYKVVHSYFEKVSTKKKLSPHLLRHAFATHLLENGADIASIKDLLGHSSLASTEVYTHFNFKELSKVHEAAHPRSKSKT
jgi:integrase/recombinase XerC